MNEYEIFDPGAVSIEPHKTIIKKVFSAQPSVFGWNSFSFQPINSNISIDAMEENTAHELLKLIGLETDYSQHVLETRRRLKLMLQRIAYTEWGADYYPFSKESLMYLTSYVNAMPNTLGYDYRRCLEEDASFLLPDNLTHDPLDVNELLLFLFMYKINRQILRIPMTGVGLFLLFFHSCLQTNYGREFRFDLAVKAVMSGLPEETIRTEVERIIYQGLA
jgi:hypothetical protein